MSLSQRPIIEYYFSFISSWTYVGSRRLQTFRKQHNAKIIYKPFDIMHVFSASGGVPVKQRSPQRQAYRLLELQRWRRIRGIPMNMHPKYYPSDPSLAHRVLLAAIEELGYDHDAVSEFATKGSETVWVNEEDIKDEETIVKVADSSGLDGRRLLDRAKSEKEHYEQEMGLTKEAVDRQVFGAPTFVYRNEPFWGQDRIEMMEDMIRSQRDPIALPKVLGV